MTNDQLADLQRQIFQQTGVRTDVYRMAGRGTLIVPEGQPLLSHNVLLRIPE